MSSPRQRKKEAHSGGGDRKDESDRATSLDRSAPGRESSAQAFSLASLLLHLSLLMFYTAVHVWGALALSGAARDKKIGYSYNPIRALMYATIQNLYIQTGYCVLAVVCDVVPASRLRQRLESVRNFLFTTIAFPLAILVTVVYWALLAVDTSYLYDERGLAVMSHVPPLLNHCWHTVVGVAVVLEVMVVVHRHPSHRVTFTTLFLLNFAYATEVLVMFYVANFVPYPFMRLLGMGGMAVFFILVLPVFLSFLYLGRLLGYLRWGERCLQTA